MSVETKTVIERVTKINERALRVREVYLGNETTSNETVAALGLGICLVNMLGEIALGLDTVAARLDSGIDDGSGLDVVGRNVGLLVTAIENLQQTVRR